VKTSINELRNQPLADVTGTACYDDRRTRHEIRRVD
jgi:hypothetical protein